MMHGHHWRTRIETRDGLAYDYPLRPRDDVDAVARDVATRLREQAIPKMMRFTTAPDFAGFWGESYGGIPQRGRDLFLAFALVEADRVDEAAVVAARARAGARDGKDRDEIDAWLARLGL